MGLHAPPGPFLESGCWEPEPPESGRCQKRSRQGSELESVLATPRLLPPNGRDAPEGVWKQRPSRPPRLPRTWEPPPGTRLRAWRELSPGRPLGELEEGSRGHGRYLANGRGSGPWTGASPVSPAAFRNKRNEASAEKSSGPSSGAAPAASRQLWRLVP